MKTAILTLIATAILSTGAFATETVLPDITPIAKIEAHGNVEVFVTTGTKDGVKVYDDYYAKSALVQEDKGILRVTNYDKNEKLVVEVTVTQLQNIAAYDNAVIKSDKLNLVDLKVDLYNQAYAGLNLNNYAANITVNDQAKADLTGSVDQYSLTYSYGSTVNRTELAAVNVEEVRVAPAMNLKGRFRNRA